MSNRGILVVSIINVEEVSFKSRVSCLCSVSKTTNNTIHASGIYFRSISILAIFVLENFIANQVFKSFVNFVDEARFDEIVKFRVKLP